MAGPQWGPAILVVSSMGRQAAFGSGASMLVTLLARCEAKTSPKLLRAQSLDGKRFLARCRAALQRDRALGQMQGAREQFDQRLVCCALHRWRAQPYAQPP